MSIVTDITRIMNAKADIKAAIEEKGVEVGDGLIDTYAEKIAEITGGGGESEADMCWSRVRKFAYIFNGVTFPEGTDIVLDVSNDITDKYYDLMYAFTNAKGIKSIKITATEKKPLYIRYAFQSSTATIIDLSDCPLIQNMQGAFQYSNYAIKEIRGELDLEYCISAIDYQNAFHYMYNLEEIRFKPDTIMFNISFPSASKLSDASIQSIIDGLYEYGGGQYVTFNDAVLDKLTTEQLDQITNKEWYLA